MVGDYEWNPIQPLTNSEKQIDLAGAPALYEVWREFRARLLSEPSNRLDQFNIKLIRRLSVETGILERIYDLDRGTTEALVEHGFAENLVSWSSTNLEPARLIEILRDQEAAIQLVMDGVAGKRRLTPGFLHELHAVLMRHQDTTDAIDPTGERHQIPLARGRYKEYPNNPRRAEGGIHHYCPPVHVAAEVDQLLEWLSSYETEDPVIVASWLHHRFAQIHPYQDGNGRVARAISTMVLVKSNLLPLVVERNARTRYIQALEEADHGALEPLAQLFAELERTAILRATSDEPESEATLTSAVLTNIGAKIRRRRAEAHADLRCVNTIGAALRDRARTFIDASLGNLATTLGGQPRFRTDIGGPEQKTSYYYKFQVTQTAKSAGTFANFSENHYFVKGSLTIPGDQLTFVTSFHHVGRELNGIMEATAFAEFDRFVETSDVHVCSSEPFVFTYRTDLGGIEKAFDLWLDAALAVAFKEFGDRL